MLVTFLQQPSVSTGFVPNNPTQLILEPTETILEARRTLIAALLNACYALIDSYQSDQLVCQAKDYKKYDYGVCHDHVRRKCDTLIFGSLVKGMKGLGISPTTLPSEDYLGSVSELIKNLRSLYCFALGERGKPDTPQVLQIHGETSFENQAQ